MASAPRLPGMAEHPRGRAGVAIFGPPAAAFPGPGQAPHPFLGEIHEPLGKSQQLRAVLAWWNGENLGL